MHALPQALEGHLHCTSWRCSQAGTGLYSCTSRLQQAPAACIAPLALWQLRGLFHFTSCQAGARLDSCTCRLSRPRLAHTSLPATAQACQQGSGLYHSETWLPHNQLLIPPHTRMSAPAVCEGLERGG